jgi:hypothetical protein
MDPLCYSCEQQGFFSRAMARDVGYDDKAVGLMVRTKSWHRFRRGYYCLTDIWNGLDVVARHLVRCRAVLHSVGDERVALSHVSGLVAHGIDVWGYPLDRVHVTRLDGASSRLEGDVVHHRGASTSADIVEGDDLRVFTPARCAIEHGTRTSSESALVSFDAALHAGHCTIDDLAASFQRMGDWPGARHLHIPLRMADGAAESVGESRGRWLFWTSGLPAPLLQYEVRDGNGELRGVCDWCWPERRTMGEFDGRTKYGRLLRPGLEPGDVVFAEKRREDELRELTGMSMVRLVWEDYERPRVTAARLSRLLGVA